MVKTSKSLRSRVIFTALAAVAITTTIVIMLLALVIGPVIKQRQVDSMKSVLAEAAQMTTFTDAQAMATILTKPGISVIISQDFSPHLPTFADVDNVKVTDIHTAQSNSLLIEAWLPKINARIAISSIDIEVFGLFETILLTGVPFLLICMVVVAIALQQAMARALKPLDDMTALATKIANGQEGGRLETKDPDTELGRTAVAFDKMLDSLEESLRRARQAETRLRQLCADVAHELRSPLASIVASADNLMRSASEKKQARELAENTALSVVREGQRAARIVGDLTLAAQLDVDELAEHQLVLRGCDLVSVLIETAHTFADRATVELKIQNSVGENVLQSIADPERLQQILNNLLDNANRMASTYVLVEFETNKTADELIVRVIDDGPGVPKEMHQAIFDRFVRLDSDRARNTGGSGLGLHISRALAEAHGGTLVSLPAKKGARFELRIPIRLAPDLAG